MRYKLESKEIISLIEQIELTGICSTDKGSFHTYTGMYEEILSGYRGKNCRLMEIGFYSGGSALLWSKYLPDAEFSFSDINTMNEEVLRLIPNKKKVYLGDAYSNEILDQVRNDNPEGFDVIIDDGTHSLPSQIECVRRYLPLVKKGGVLIIDDVQHMSWCKDLLMEVPVEYRNNVCVHNTTFFKGRNDDIVFIIKK